MVGIINLGVTFRIKVLNRNHISSHKKLNLIQRNARASKVEEKETSGELINSDNNPDGTVPLPYSGLIGMEGRNLFEKPLEVYDPTKELMDVPGKDGSEEQMLAMQKKIQDRVEALKKSGEWQRNNEEFGKDPLSEVPIWSAMISQLKSSKPFETWDEFALTYVLVLVLGTVMMGYILSIGYGIDEFIEWFEKTDFDSDFFQNLFSRSS
jgi:hypothetical protein